MHLSTRFKTAHWLRRTTDEGDGFFGIRMAKGKCNEHEEGWTSARAFSRISKFGLESKIVVMDDLFWCDCKLRS